jgi:hypothetical protein
MNLRMHLWLIFFVSLLSWSSSYAYQAEEYFGGGNGGTTIGGTNGGTTIGGTNGGTTIGGTNGGTTIGGTNGGTTIGGTNGGTVGGGTNGGTTGGGSIGCTRTQGYWGSSPAGQQRLIFLVGGSGLFLGNINYSATELDDILDQPAGGNALVILAHQLIAAKLNVLNGADDSQIAADIQTADGLIGNNLIPPVGTAFVSPGSTLGQQMTQVKNRLDSYNNGNLNVPHCN